jgi:hypothetical protein
MQELFPVAAGALLGMVALRITTLRWRILAVVAVGVLVGVIASATSGELAESWAFVLVDTTQVILVAALTMAAGILWQRRGARTL